VKALESKETKAQRNETVTHNSVFAAAHRQMPVPRTFGAGIFLLRPNQSGNQEAKKSLETGTRISRILKFWGAQAASRSVSAACRDNPGGLTNRTRKAETQEKSFLKSQIGNRHSAILSAGGIAQLVERQLCKLEVRGSNPLASSLRSRRSRKRRLSRRNSSEGGLI
jgi:hypothetical protein